MSKLVALIAFIIAPIIVSAATATHTVQVSPTRTNWTFTNAIPQWNPADGTLNSVTVSVAGNVRSEYRVENRDTVPGTVATTTTANVTATVGGVASNSSITLGHTQDVAAFDGAIDYAGVSGFTTNSIGTGSNVETATVLTPFIGTGTVGVSVSSDASASVGGLGYYRFIVNTFSSAIVTVTYDFTPLCPECPSCDPEPEECDDRNDRRKPRNRRR